MNFILYKKSLICTNLLRNKDMFKEKEDLVNKAYSLLKEKCSLLKLDGYIYAFSEARDIMRDITINSGSLNIIKLYNKEYSYELRSHYGNIDFKPENQRYLLKLDKDLLVLFLTNDIIKNLEKFVKIGEY